MKRLIICFLFLAVTTCLHAQELQISQSVDKTEIAFEDSVLFKITLEWKGSQADILFTQPLHPYIDRMKVRGFNSVISSKDIGGQEVTTKTYNFTLIPTTGGEALIDSVAVHYMKPTDSIPAVLMTEPVAIQIAMPQPKKKESDRLPYWIIVVGGVLIGAGLIFFVLKSKKKETVIVLSPKEQFLEDLTVLKSESKSDLKIFQTGLYRLLLKYVNEEHKTDLSRYNDDEYIKVLTDNGMKVANAEQISKWIVQADKDKFAPAANAPGETIRLESEVRAYFEKI